MNLYLYFLTAKTMKRPVTRRRIVAGSAGGAILAVVIFLVPGMPGMFRRLIGPAMASLLTTAFIFKLKHMEAVFRVTGYLLIYAFLFGGMMKILPQNKRGIWYLLGIGMLGYVTASWWLEQMARKKEAGICRVRLCGYTQQLEVRALIDTGNSLREPVSRKPVAVIDRGILEEIPELRVCHKLKLIPYHSVGKSHGMMEGYEIPGLVIEQEEGRIECPKVIVGISQNKISASGKYQMILHPELCSRESISGSDLCGELHQ